MSSTWRWVICAAWLAATGCGGSSTQIDTTGGGGGTGNDGGAPDGSAATCGTAGESCATGDTCCSGECDAASHVCTSTFAKPITAGGGCMANTDCATLSCVNGLCSSIQCTSDGQPCTDNGACCGGACTGGACAALNGSCKTAGNSCATHGECCSKLCTNGTCILASSFCIQNGDACGNSGDCCGGVCTKAAGSALGLCSEPHAPGTTGCTVAGVACGGVVADAGASGIPACGGECCSRACAPHKSGLRICQPPSGCRPTGEICRGDSVCCGFNGEKGVTGVGNCSKGNPTDLVGRCDNGNACRPAGAVCKLATGSCNAENNCCAGNVNKNPLVCQQDILGIPRCTMSGEACADGGSQAGKPCASSADCCGLACAPNPTVGPNMPAFICGGICVGTGGACSTTADCCPGLPCILALGSSRGTCGAQPPNYPPPGDSGMPVNPPYDANVPDAQPPAGCAEYGQICSQTSDCCGGVACTNGRCYEMVN